MAEVHVGQRCVISLDIKNFFPSIKQAHLQSLFTNLGFGKEPAWVLSELCTYKAFVPQGALTSPKISCLVTGGSFGPPIAKFCELSGLRLTIYADDITMSYSREFESREKESAFVKAVIDFVRKTLSGFGFTLNAEKTKIMRPYNRQWVCGAVVNEKVNMRKDERANLRALVFNCQKNGISAEAAKTGMTEVNFIRKFGGRLNWFAQLNAEQGKPLKNTFLALAKPLLKQYPEIEIDKLAWSSTLELSEWDHDTVEEVIPEGTKVLTTGDFPVVEEPAPF